LNGSAPEAPGGEVSADSTRASKLRRRRGPEPSEEAAGQARAIVDHDAPANHAGLIQNHSKFLTQGLSPRQSIDWPHQPFSSCAGLTRLRGRSPSGAAKARASIKKKPFAQGRWIAGSSLVKPGNDDAGTATLT